MQVLDDGHHVQLAPHRRFGGAVTHLVQRQQVPRLTQEQAEVLAIVVMDGLASRRRIEEVRGAAALSIGAGGARSAAAGQLGDAGALALAWASLCRSGRSRDGAVRWSIGPPLGCSSSSARRRSTRRAGG
jgi:hypothetical protein